MTDNTTSITLQIDGPDGQVKSFKGRVAWALAHLIAAGEKGCTPPTHVGPRWSHYVYMARRQGVTIATLHEGHGGPYSGHHARYVLKSLVTVLSQEVAAHG